MVTFAAWLGAIGSLLPIVVMVWARSRRERSLGDLALDIASALSVDFLSLLVLTLFLRLEVATVVSRVLWLAFGLIVVLRQRRLPAIERAAFPSALSWRIALSVGTAAITSTLLSLAVSRPYSVWDRKFHTPLVSSMRGQTVPFQNSLNLGEGLHYHFTGDLHAAIVQTCSGGVVHSSLALSVSHDVAFALIGVTIALHLAERGVRPWLLGLAPLLPLLAGPLTLFRERAPGAVEGYSILNFYTMSFRPHDAVAGVFFVAFVAAVVARLERPAAPLGDSTLHLVLATAGLAITDETSLGVLGLALGVLWLFRPEVVHPKRSVGVAIFALLALALVVPNVAFGGAFSPGAQRHRIVVVPFRSPGCYTPTLPLTQALGRRMLAFDLAPSLVLVVGAWIAAFRGGALARTLAGFATAIFVLSALMLTTLDVNSSALESHRFMSGAVFVLPVLALFLLAVARVAPARPRFIGLAASVLGMALGAASTTHWIVDLAPRKLARHTHFFTQLDLYALDCRRDVGARLFERSELNYLAKDIWYAYAGCHPLFALAARQNPQWTVTIGNPYFERAQLEQVHRRIPADRALDVICPTAGALDPVCAWAVQNARCEPRGRLVRRCQLGGAEREAVLR